MCKVWSLIYSCKHRRQVRLSQCRGAFSNAHKNTPDDVPNARCSHDSTLTFRVPMKCGPCAKTKASAELDAVLAEARARFPASWDNPELAAAENEHGRQLLLLEQGVPGAQFKKLGSAEQGQRTTSMQRKESLLRREIQPEDVVAKDEPIKKAAVSVEWNWGAAEEQVEETWTMDCRKKAGKKAPQVQDEWEEGEDFELFDQKDQETTTGSAEDWFFSQEEDVEEDSSDSEHGEVLDIETSTDEEWSDSEPDNETEEDGSIPTPVDSSPDTEAQAMAQPNKLLHHTAGLCEPLAFDVDFSSNMELEIFVQGRRFRLGRGISAH